MLVILLKGRCLEEKPMSFNKKDVKHGIDAAADKLKQATDKIAATAEHANAGARKIGRKAGDTLIEQGEKLKQASSK
jgi:hypothetical protein